MRKSSIHFEQVKSAMTSIAHSERTEEKEPGYLLPKEFRLGNVIVPGSLSDIEIGLEFAQSKDRMTGQAKARGSSPFWEGVVVLDGTDLKAQTAALQSWKKEYEKLTGQRVLHIAIHRDEGFVNSEGKPEYNIHAHVIVNRLNDKGRVIKLERKQLSAVQDLTAKSLGMQRGETLEERKGMRGRKHMNHREFRKAENEKRLDVEQVKVKLDKSQSDLTRQRKLSKEWSDADLEKVKDLQAKLDGEPARQAAALAAQKLQLDEQYRKDREALKASGEAKQADYQALKKAHEKALADLATAQAEAAKVPALEAQITQQAEAFDKLKTDAMAVITPLRTEVKTMKTQIDQLEAAKLEADKTRFADMAKAHQDGKAAGIAAHLIVPGTTPVPSSIKPAVLTPTPIPREATKAAVEPPKQPQAPIPSPKPEKSLVERLGESMKAMVGWIKALGADQEPVTASSRHDGPVKHMDDLHCVQKTGRRYAVHRLSELDNVPALDDPKMTIRYKDGKGIVEGRLGKSGVER